MPPKPQESLVKGYCAKMKTPPKGVGGAIVESLELKRNVSQSRRGNKVFERAIEERQISPGVATTRIGTNIYYFDNADSAFNAKMEKINAELTAKCNEMDALNTSLAVNELRMAQLDAELEKLNIIGDDAIEEAIIMESEDLDLLLVPSIQNLIFKIYSEAGIPIPPDSEASPKKGLKDICKEFCKDKFNELDREQNPNLQNTSCGGDNVCSPFVELSAASDLSEVQEAPSSRTASQQRSNQSQRRQRSQSPARAQRPADRLQCMDNCVGRFGTPRRQEPNTPPAQPPCPCRRRAAPTNSYENGTPTLPPRGQQRTPPPRPPRRQAEPPPTLPPRGRERTPPPRPPRRQAEPPPTLPPRGRERTPPPRPPRAQAEPPPTLPSRGRERTPPPRPPRANRAPCRRAQTPPARRNQANNNIEDDIALAHCINDCQDDSNTSLAQSTPAPPARPRSPARRKSPAPQSRRENEKNAKAAGCLGECDRVFDNEQGRLPVPPKEPAATPPPPPPPAPKPEPPPPPPPPAPENNEPKSPLDECIEDCRKRLGEKAEPPAKRISPRPPLFSKILNGKRCFPDISEIQQKEQILYLAERDAYVLFRRQFADRGNDCKFFEHQGEFEEFFYNYINGTSKINVLMCPPKPPEKSSSEELIQSFVELQKIELDATLQRNVIDLALDRPDRDPEVIALLMNERLPLWIDPLNMAELALPYPMHKRLFATDVRLTSPGSVVPRTIPVQSLNLMNTHVLEGVEAIIKSNEFLYPTDNIVTEDIENIQVVKPQGPMKKMENNYKCIIELHPFRVETFFQLRGANVPLWYPGMFTAFPDGTSSVKLVSTPSALINTAWRMCAP